jgi:hypothetical protein
MLRGQGSPVSTPANRHFLRFLNVRRTPRNYGFTQLSNYTLLYSETIDL